MGRVSQIVILLLGLAPAMSFAARSAFVTRAVERAVQRGGRSQIVQRAVDDMAHGKPTRTSVTVHKLIKGIALATSSAGAGDGPAPAAAPRSRGRGTVPHFMDSPMTSAEHALVYKQLSKRLGGNFNFAKYAKANPGEVFVTHMAVRKEQLQRAAGVRFLSEKEGQHLEDLRKLRAKDASFRTMDLDAYMFQVVNAHEHAPQPGPKRGGVRAIFHAEHLLKQASAQGVELLTGATQIAHGPADMHGSWTFDNERTRKGVRQSLHWKEGAVFLSREEYQFNVGGDWNVTWHQLDPKLVAPLLKNAPKEYSREQVERLIRLRSPEAMSGKKIDAAKVPKALTGHAWFSPMVDPRGEHELFWKGETWYLKHQDRNTGKETWRELSPEESRKVGSLHEPRGDGRGALGMW